MMVLVTNTFYNIKDVVSNKVRDELKQKAKRKAEDFLNSYDISLIGLEEGEFINISFNITTRKGNHLCLRILKSSEDYEYHLVSIKHKDIDYFAYATPI